jgi:hypothetical protein
MNNTIKSVLTATVLATALFATSASAEVTFNPATGTGFVGKGDVQSAFEWNDAGLQAHADGISFTFAVSATWNVPCVNNKARTPVFHVFKRHTSFDAGIVAHVARENPNDKVTGFILTGFDGSSSDNHNLSCPGIWEANGEPTLVSGSNGTSLFVHHGDETRQLFFIAD